MRRKARTHPERFPLGRLHAIRTVREFDEHITAPHFGFAGADDYYYKVSAARVIDRVRVPTLIITAADDPFVPTGPFRDPRVTSNPNITLIVTEHGGHCGFVTAGPHGQDCYWAEDRIMDFAKIRV
jgi:predicted alpha/beta-fold hydrolase